MRGHDEACKILLEIEELTKSLSKGPKIWNDHLAKYLDEYMACVEDMSSDDTLGVMAISFVQAGRLLESSSKVYGLNVDYLWQFMTEVMAALRINASSKNNEKRSDASAETADGSANHEEGSQKRRKRAVFEDFEKIVVNVIDPDIKAAERNEQIKPLPPQHIVTKPDCKLRKNSYKIVDVDGDTVVPSDYSVMLQTSRDGKLQMNMLKEVVNECSEVPTLQQSPDELVHFLELLVKELSNGDTHHGSDDDPAIGNPLSQGSTSGYTCTDQSEHPALVSLPVTPPTSPESASRSTPDAETPERIKRSLSETVLEEEVCAAAYCAERPGEKEHLVTWPHDVCESVALEDSIHEKPLAKRQTFSLPCDMKMLKLDGRKHKSGHKMKMELIVTYHGTEVLRTFLTEALFPLCRDFEQLYLGNNAKKVLLDQPTDRGQEDFLHLLSKEYDEDFLGFEDYEPVIGEEEEGEEFLGWPDEEVVDRRGCNTSQGSSTNVPLPVAVSNGNEHSTLSQSHGRPDMAHEDMEADIAKRVAEWESYVRPKLKIAHERGHFDIHKFGTEILESFSESSQSAALQFEQFVADKPTADIPRYFLASLQLANTYNIEISQSSGDLPMDCMNMALLSPVRHHEGLEDYEVPSLWAKNKPVNLVVESSDNNGDRLSNMFKKKSKHVSQARARNIDSDGDSLSNRNMFKKKHKHVSYVRARNSDKDGDSSSNRNMFKKKRKHVSHITARNNDSDGDSSSNRNMFKKKHKHVSHSTARNSDSDGDSLSNRNMFKKKHKHISQVRARNIDSDGDSSSNRNMFKKKHKHVSYVRARNSDTDGDSSSNRNIFKKKRKHVGHITARNSDSDGDSLSNRNMFKKKHKCLSEVTASNSDSDGDSLANRNVFKNKRKRLNLVTGSTSDSDGDSLANRRVCKNKRNKR